MNLTDMFLLLWKFLYLREMHGSYDGNSPVFLNGCVPKSASKKERNALSAIVDILMLTLL